ncbi:hypothetical protein Btru_075353, partial [Bulinus truncatus]
LASNGKRNTALPPLENNSNGLQPLSSADNPGDVTQRSYQKVSVRMDKKIVTHLKRKLSQRNHRRSDVTTDQWSSKPGSGVSSRENLKSGKSIDGRERLFSTYTEIGEKIHPRPGRSNRKQSTAAPRLSPRVAPIQTGAIDDSRGTTGCGLANGDGSDTDTQNSEQCYPDSEDEELSDLTQLSKRKGKPTKTLITEVSNMESSLDETDVSINDEDIEEISQTEDSLVDLVVSPVQSPVASRPPTQENVRYAAEDSMTHILGGLVNRKCPQDRTVVSFYVASGPSDFDAERSFLQENLYPRLREYYLERGHEIRILDLHWGFKDTIWDDHSISHVIHRTITKSQETKFGINFLVLVGQKCGPKIIPAEIRKEDFEAIMSAASAYREEQLWLNSIKMSQIEAQREQREKELVSLTAEDIAETDEGAQNVSIDKSDSTVNNRRMSTEQSVNESAVQVADERRRKRSMAQRQEQQAIKLLKESEDHLPDLDSLTHWYLLDTNAVPPVYRLQNISTVFKDITRNDVTKRNLAKATFLTLADKFADIFSTFAPKTLTNLWFFEHSSSSVFARELEEIIESDNFMDNTLYLVRNIEGLTENLDDPTATDYLDLASERPARLDSEAMGKIKQIQETIHKIMGSKVSNFLLEWSPGGIRPNIRREHLVHVERMSKVIFDSVIRHLGDRKAFKQNFSWQEELFLEVAEHVRTCHEKARNFRGRKDLLTEIKTYLRSRLDTPLVLHGKTGSGKSTLLGKTAVELFKWLKR